MRFASPIDLYHVIKHCWSAETVCRSGTPGAFDPANPCRNQCAVTALAVRHYFGGDLVRSATQGGTHFYNHIDGRYWDLATDQFHEPISYDNTPTTVDEAHQHAGAAELSALIAAIEGHTHEL